MKIKHNKTKAKDTIGVKPAALLKKASELERNGELDEAASLYEKIIKADPNRETAYNRLMIILRKQKEYKKELALINKGIKTFKDIYEPSSKKSFNKKVEQMNINKNKSLLIKLSKLIKIMINPYQKKTLIKSWHK